MTYRIDETKSGHQLWQFCAGGFHLLGTFDTVKEASIVQKRLQAATEKANAGIRGKGASRWSK